MSGPEVVADGFSLINRWLLYASIMLAPAQYAAGVGSNCPSNLGFLAFNYYSQVIWYRATKADTIHALSMVLPHFNLVYALTYLGGVASGNKFMAVASLLGTAGVMILNSITAWTSWAVNQRQGFGTYQFFFFGWRTLSPKWHKFFLLWQIFDSIDTVGCCFLAIYLTWLALDLQKKHNIRWWYKYVTIFAGAPLALFVSWPLIMWTELIVARNHIESKTDWISVWLFIAQAATMLVPSLSHLHARTRRPHRAAHGVAGVNHTSPAVRGEKSGVAQSEQVVHAV